MTTSPVMGITEEILGEIEQKAKAAIEDGIEEGFDYDPSIGMTLYETRFACAANPTTILAMIAHIRSLEARLAYIDRNFVGATFDYDGDGMAAMVVRISDRVSVFRDAMAVLDDAIAQEGQSHE